MSDTVMQPDEIIDGESRAVANPINGAEVLDAVYAYIGRFVAYPSEAERVAHTLWIAHTHAMEEWESTPRIAFLSPEPGSGKSRALEVTEALVPRPVEAVNVSPAYLFRKVSAPEGRPTILFDEIDTVFGPRAKENEEIRGLLNAGHRKHAVAGRCVVVGKTVMTEEIPAYCAVALAGIGGLPDTIRSRAMLIEMRRRSADEIVEPYRRRVNAPAGHAIRDRLAAWLLEYRLRDWPAMPSEICDRDADIWEAAFAIADAAGGGWPKRARAAAVALVAESKQSAPSLGVKLLHDLRAIFDTADALPTETILMRLKAIEESPWADLRGKPIDSRGLSYRLRPYGIAPTTIRVGDRTPKGYRRQDLHDAWSRYLGSSSEEGATSATTETDSPDVAAVAAVASKSEANAAETGELRGAVAGVALVAHEPEPNLDLSCPIVSYRLSGDGDCCWATARGVPGASIESVIAELHARHGDGLVIGECR